MKKFLYRIKLNIFFLGLIVIISKCTVSKYEKYEKYEKYDNNKKPLAHPFFGDWSMAENYKHLDPWFPDSSEIISIKEDGIIKYNTANYYIGEKGKALRPVVTTVRKGDELITTIQSDFFQKPTPVKLIPLKTLVHGKEPEILYKMITIEKDFYVKLKKRQCIMHLTKIKSYPETVQKIFLYTSERFDSPEEAKNSTPWMLWFIRISEREGDFIKSHYFPLDEPL